MSRERWYRSLCLRVRSATTSLQLGRSDGKAAFQESSASKRLGASDGFSSEGNQHSSNRSPWVRQMAANRRKCRLSATLELLPFAAAPKATVESSPMITRQSLQPALASRATRRIRARSSLTLMWLRHRNWKNKTVFHGARASKRPTCALWSDNPCPKTSVTSSGKPLRDKQGSIPRRSKSRASEAATSAGTSVHVAPPANKLASDAQIHGDSGARREMTAHSCKKEAATTSSALSPLRRVLLDAGSPRTCL